ncbi:Cloroperoxidase [Ramaria rubella]|nr:Cloroperoxidase [Ramaria rubella]
MSSSTITLIATPEPNPSLQNLKEPILEGNITPRVAKPVECPHAFRPPAGQESRGPCPALNTLANHGYLPHDGHNITPEILLAALQNRETYHISGPLAQVLVYGGFFMMHGLGWSSISLHELALHGCIEHDASMVHKNTAPDHIFAPTKCDPVLLDELLDNSDSLTLERVAKRRVQLETVSPLDAVHQEIARGEWALVMDIFGRAHGKIPSDFLRVWLRENKFPEGWRPTHEQGLLATVWMSARIQKQMNSDRKLESHNESPKRGLMEAALLKRLESTPADYEEEGGERAGNGFLGENKHGIKAWRLR